MALGNFELLNINPNIVGIDIYPRHIVDPFRVRYDNELTRFTPSPIARLNPYMVSAAHEFFERKRFAPTEQKNVVIQYTLEDFTEYLLNRKTLNEMHQNLEGSGDMVRRHLHALTNTYQEHSRVDPIKASRYAEKQHKDTLSKKFGLFSAVGYALFKGFIPTFKQAVGDSLLARGLAGLAGAVTQWPKITLAYGIGNIVGSITSYKKEKSTRGQFVSHLVQPSHELISYPLSKIAGQQLLRYPIARNFASNLLNTSAKTYNYLGNKLDSKWFSSKGTHWVNDSIGIKNIGDKFITGNLEKALGKETLQELTPIFQELAGIPIDIALLYLFTKNARKIGRWVDKRDQSKRDSDRRAYTHIGVGEKGPSSRYQANKLITYRNQSTIDPLKAAFLAELQLKTLYKPSGIKSLTPEKLYNKLFSKYPITKREFNILKNSGRLEKALKKRGVNIKEVREELRAFHNKENTLSTEQRVFISPREKQIRDTRKITSHLSGKEISNKIAFDKINIKIPKAYGIQEKEILPEEQVQINTLGTTREPTQDIQTEIGNRNEYTSTSKSHVNIILSDAEIDWKVLDKQVSRKLRRGY